MKNQNDLIAWIVAGVLTIIGVVICFAMIQRQVVPPVAPATVATAVPPLPVEAPVMVASLPAGSGGAGGGSGSGLPTFGGGPGGRPGGMGGPPPGMGGPMGGGGGGKGKFAPIGVSGVGGGGAPMAPPR
jgi:hypothetical protein